MAAATGTQTAVTGKIIEAMIAAGLLLKAEDIAEAYKIIHAAVGTPG